MFLNLSLKN